MATGIERFKEIYEGNNVQGVSTEEKMKKNSEQMNRFNELYENSGAGYIAYKKYIENVANLPQKIQSNYDNVTGQWQSSRNACSK